LTVHTAEAGTAGLGLDVVEVNAGQILEELTDVTVRDVAEMSDETEVVMFILRRWA